jgi:hypothetical protein
MIHILPTHITSFRTFGWVQDPSNFRSLCDVVAIFDNQSSKHRELINEIIPRLIEERDGRDDLMNALRATPLKIKYSKLVGSSFTPRAAARCNGIIQATVPGQVRPFISDWPADNFLRWAHAFGFIKYNYSDDTFEITNSGRELVAARTEGDEINENEKELLITAILSYPPAVRILNLLSETEDTHLTKYELGKMLGFFGEGGFTSLPQSILIRALATTESASEKNKMKTDWDGSSDKYARMIAKWLEKLGLVIQRPKRITVNIVGEDYSETIGQAYMISAAGLSALNRTIGRSRHRRIPKNVCFEMLATKGSDREYLRTRRAYILKSISESRGTISFEQIKDYLSTVSLNESIDTIKDDVKGLINIGLNIIIDNETCTWNDQINDFILPLPQNLTRSNLTSVKEEVRSQISNISHEYLSLIDLAYDSNQNRLFEMKTIELLVEECEYNGLHLGGSRRPDGIIYTNSLPRNYGVIVDTKAYSKGYNLPISQADEMERYIRENQTRDTAINPNEWWNAFGQDVSEFYFMFVSGHFTGNYASQLDRISRNTRTNGTALNVVNLLLCANAYKSGELTHESIKEIMFNNNNFEMQEVH